MWNMQEFPENLWEQHLTVDENTQHLPAICAHVGDSAMESMDTDCRTKCTVHPLLTQPYSAPAQGWN